MLFFLKETIPYQYKVNSASCGGVAVASATDGVVSFVILLRFRAEFGMTEKLIFL